MGRSCRDGVGDSRQEMVRESGHAGVGGSGHEGVVE